MANRNKEDHSDCVLNGKNLGENVYSNEKYFTGKEMTDEFYREIVNYDFTKGECEPQAARFTQLVWKETKEVGFGIAKNEQTGKIFDCVKDASNYYNVARTNIIGEAGRELYFTADIPEYDDYVTQKGYLADFKPQMYYADDTTIKYNSIKFSVIGGVYDG